ncbi:Flocculation suppression protein [Dimargaris verticillata]|uniref:Flocculation suppression protein n=1 Tax=Dimargaris verticillata TaxID=2761393 RepID=A0A9W8B8L8_9FUNG|nr:Flocculation suppression protein [Dimargaris verticillata]
MYTPDKKTPGPSQNAPKNQAAFVNKLYSMVEDPANQPLIHWSRCGEKFTVTNHNELAREILPRYFKHGNWQSFVRQLNMYGFHKVNDVFHGNVAPDAQIWEFKHPEFICGRPDLLNNIKRRTPKSSQAPVATKDPYPSPSESAPPSASRPLITTPHSPLYPPVPDRSSPDWVARLEHQHQHLQASYNRLLTDHQSLLASQNQSHRAISQMANFLTSVFTEEDSPDPAYQAQLRKKRKLEVLSLNAEITRTLLACESHAPAVTHTTLPHHGPPTPTSRAPPQLPPLAPRDHTTAPGLPTARPLSSPPGAEGKVSLPPIASLYHSVGSTV